MPFAEIIGQDRAVQPLRAALARGALHHAYLFAGPEGVGKAGVARLLAQAANCLERSDDACGTCAACRKIARGMHPDVIVVEQERKMAKEGRWEPKGGRTPSIDIVVDQIRDLVDHRLGMKRFEARRRFVILDPADAMNQQAQNALLKTLEEPPEDTTLVLVSAGADALLPTIRSRCARVTFAALPEEFVAERLVASGRDPAEARLSAAMSGGSLGRALALDTGALREREEAVISASALDVHDAGAWIAFARDHGADRDGARAVCDLLVVWLRDVLAFQAAGDEARLALADLAETTRAAAREIEPLGAVRRLELAAAASTAIGQNAAPTLALERMLIGWFHGELR
jgi:DNA polymerase-3 subunit delta'